MRTPKSARAAVRRAGSGPTRQQVRITETVVAWYIRTYYRTADDPGTLAMFSDPARVGAFAVTLESLQAGDADALARLLIACAMFQRQRDTIVMRILRSLDPARVVDLTDPARLRDAIRACPCEHQVTLVALNTTCDVGKEPTTGAGICTTNTAVACHLKAHAVLLKRYGDFGKLPTSVALLLQESGFASLQDAYESVVRRHRTRLDRSRAMVAFVSRVWRVSEKIACMYLSLLANPALSPAPWQHGLDWTHFVVVDSNVDLFLNSIGFEATRDYDTKRWFIQEIAKQIDLRALDRRLQKYNPRVVQQALYLFMSAANRREAVVDCANAAPATCARCPKALVDRCPVGV